LEEGTNVGAEEAVEGLEKLKEGLKRPQEKAKKKQKFDKAHATSDGQLHPADTTSQSKSLTDTKVEKKQRRKERRKAKEQERQQKRQSKTGKDPQTQPEDTPSVPTTEDPDGQEDSFQEMAPINIDNLSPASPSSLPQSPLFDTINNIHSGTSSTSSIIPPTIQPEANKAPSPFQKRKIPALDPAELRARWDARMALHRAQRGLDSLDSSTARSRQELMESRRRKEEKRQAHKKELRAQAKLEERERREAALQASLRNSPVSFASGSNASPILGSPLRPQSDDEPTSFSFGRIAFADGQTLSPTASTLLDPRKRKGPSDTSTALLAAEHKRQRIAGLDDSKRADIEEKDRWLNARKRVHGERVRDDTSLLKKTLKRKEKAKKKSEGEWRTRLEGVEKGKEMRQRKREDNLRKRKDEKGSKSKGKSKSKSTPSKSKTKGKKSAGRPGFEGSFRAKPGGGGGGAGGSPRGQR
jgi:hypothetical protein